MKCYDCNNTITKQDQFCSHCGRVLKSKKVEYDSFSKNNKIITFPNQEAIAALNHLKAIRKAKNKNSFNKFFIVLILSSILASIFTSLGWFTITVSFFILFFLGALFTGGIRSKNISYNDYSTLPNVMGTNNKMYCIYCGHTGIYTHGEYRTKVKYHDCSRCSTNLYTSH